MLCYWPWQPCSPHSLSKCAGVAGRRHLRRRYLPSDLDDARETDDTIEWDDTTIEDDTRVVGPRWRRRPYGVIDDDGWAGDGEPVDPGAELALVLFARDRHFLAGRRLGVCAQAALHRRDALRRNV